MATGAQLLDLERWIEGKDSTDICRMVAALLRDGDAAVCMRLANIIDPDVMPDAHGTRLVFKRTRGNRSRQIDAREVAAAVWHRIKAGDPRESAYQHAVDTLNVSLRTAKAAFAEWEAKFERHPEFARTAICKK
jgi:hypothetical protein